MTSKLSVGVFSVIWLLVSAVTVYAVDQRWVESDGPAILTALGIGAVVRLDDSAVEDIRGQAPGPRYVMVSIVGFNSLDKFPKGETRATWVFGLPGDLPILVPLWRYGNWGGMLWGDGSKDGSAVDQMDRLFRTHDNAISAAKSRLSDIKKANRALLDGLGKLPTQNKDPYKFWGPIYITTPKNAPAVVSVSAYSSFNGGKSFKGFKDMPFSEYARRQATFVFSAFSGIGLAKMAVQR